MSSTTAEANVRTRTESDSMGSIEVPDHVYWGAPDAALAAPLCDWARHDAARADSRIRHTEEATRARALVNKHEPARRRMR